MRLKTGKTEGTGSQSPKKTAVRAFSTQITVRSRKARGFPDQPLLVGQMFIAVLLRNPCRDTTLSPRSLISFLKNSC